MKLQLKYEDLVHQATYEAEVSAKMYVTQMIAALRAEVKGISNEEIRDRIEADLADTWSKNTLRKTWPEEFKNTLMRRPKKLSQAEIATNGSQIELESAETERDDLEMHNLIANSGKEDISIIGQLQGEKERLEARIEELENGPPTPEKSRLIKTMGSKLEQLIQPYEVSGQIQCDCGKWIDVLAEIYPERKTVTISKDYFRKAKA